MKKCATTPAQQNTSGSNVVADKLVAKQALIVQECAVMTIFGNATFAGIVSMNSLDLRGILTVDVINEHTIGSGTLVNGVLLANGNVTGGLLCANNGVLSNVLNEKTLNSGVTIETVLLKDGNVSTTGTVRSTGMFTDIINPNLNTNILVNGVNMGYNGFNTLATNELCVPLAHIDIINEKTLNHGVIIEGIMLKDGMISVPITGTSNCIQDLDLSATLCIDAIGAPDTMVLTLDFIEKEHMETNGAWSQGLRITTGTAGQAGTGIAIATGVDSSAFGQGTQNIVTLLGKPDIDGRTGVIDLSASGLASHAEGGANIASGIYSHAEGAGTQAIGAASHTEGLGNKAVGMGAHSGGCINLANGNASLAGGYNSNALNNGQWSRGTTQFASLGDAQINRHIVKGTRNGMGLVNLEDVLNGHIITVPTNKSWSARVQVVGVDLISNDQFTYEQNIRVKNVADVLSITPLAYNSWGEGTLLPTLVAVSYGSTGNRLTIIISTSSPNTTRWVATVDSTQIG